MAPARLPRNEPDRLAALQSYDILDTACERTFDEIAGLAAKLTHSAIALVSLVDAERQWFKARIGLEAEETPRAHSFCAHAILGSDMLEVCDATADPRFADNPLVTGEPTIRHYAGVPLINPEGLPLGTLCVIDRVPRALDAEERATLEALAHTAMTTLELHRAMRQVRRLALTDALTGLPNRPALQDALDRAIARQRRHGEPFALLYLDLDGFKAVNDSFGHAAGDMALREVAHVLRTLARREDIPARLGGDEFAMVLVKCDDLEVSAVAGRIREAIVAAMTAARLAVTVSIGAARFAEPPESVPHALMLADRMMYDAKLAGKNRVVSMSHPLCTAEAA